MYKSSKETIYNWKLATLKKLSSPENFDIKRINIFKILGKIHFFKDFCFLCEIEKFNTIMKGKFSRIS